MKAQAYQAIVIGVSAGGLSALTAIFSTLPNFFSLPIILVQHRAKDHKELLEEVLRRKSTLPVEQASEKEKILAGHIYVAPPDYHLLIEDDLTFSLSSAERVVHSRPSIDVLFESAALVWYDRLIAIILTGASVDGSRGIRSVRKNGGLTIAQDPQEAEFPLMPRSAIETKQIVHIWNLKKICAFLEQLHV